LKYFNIIDNNYDAMGSLDTTLNGHTSSDAFGNTVLVVEDDDTTREIIVGCLLDRQLGLNIETASNGEEALAKIAQRVPSVLITNINMPKMNGIALLKTLHERGISIPTLVTSGWWSHEAFEKELAERGIVPEKMVVFLQKPFRFKELGVLVEKLRLGEPNNLKSQQS
jgi:CheY-like chemotaxis protein